MFIDNEVRQYLRLCNATREINGFTWKKTNSPYLQLTAAIVRPAINILLAQTHGIFTGFRSYKASHVYSIDFQA